MNYKENSINGALLNPVRKIHENGPPKRIGISSKEDIDNHIHEYIVGKQCFLTSPCQHHVTYQGKTKMLFAYEIYKHFYENGLHVPEHFMYAKNIYKKHKIQDEIDFILNRSNITYDFNNIVKIIDKYELKYKKYSKCKDNLLEYVFNICLKHGNLDVIKYCIEERGFIIEKEYIYSYLDRNWNRIDNIDERIFVYLANIYNGYDIEKETLIADFYSFSICLVERNNLTLLKYIIEELGYDFHINENSKIPLLLHVREKCYKVKIGCFDDTNNSNDNTKKECEECFDVKILDSIGINRELDTSIADYLLNLTINKRKLILDQTSNKYKFSIKQKYLLDKLKTSLNINNRDTNNINTSAFEFLLEHDLIHYDVKSILRLTHNLKFNTFEDYNKYVEEDGKILDKKELTDIVDEMCSLISIKSQENIYGGILENFVENPHNKNFLMGFPKTFGMSIKSIRISFPRNKFIEEIHLMFNDFPVKFDKKVFPMDENKLDVYEFITEDPIPFNELVFCLINIKFILNEYLCVENKHINIDNIEMDIYYVRYKDTFIGSDIKYISINKKCTGCIYNGSIIISNDNEEI